MRLSDHQIRIIKEHVETLFGADATVRVFGSRVDGSRSGGDVDLLVETSERVALAKEIQLAARLELQLGAPVDIISTWPGQKSRPIVEIAKLTGVTL